MLNVMIIKLIIDTISPTVTLASIISRRDSPIFLDYLECLGSEFGLLDCRRNSPLGLSDCSQDLVGVICPGEINNYTINSQS